ncbi:hypothetical protein N7492_003450 [Penicillium capsulatum]|uniref:Uncharacterized protein n=1 Tax=Penicillium capsulatum TaxID=69766 RepID=A0A9W9INN6_9EURO|nr:hypothetical protein N7492_003450 [Penicillium capsulatum]
MGFLKSPHRVGGPLLCSLPSWRIPARNLPVPGNNDNTNREIERIAQNVLNGLHLEFLDCQVIGRLSKVDPEPRPVPTVLIIMPNRPQPDLWYRAARKICQNLRGHGHSGFSVELIEAALLEGIYCFPVELRHSIFSKWQGLVEEIVRRSDTREWTGLDCWRYGTNVDRKANPVTVIIRVTASAKGPFTTAARFVHGILASFDEADVDVLFQKDDKRRFVEDPTLYSESATGQVYPGMSIGIHGSEAGSSTLGSFVQLRFKGENHWSTYGLTCFHCVWPPENHREDPKMQTPEASKALDRWVNRPLSMRDNPSLCEMAKKILRVDHPSPGDLSNTIDYYKSRMRRIRSPEFWEYKTQIERGGDGWSPDSAKRRYEAWCKAYQHHQETCAPFSQMLRNASYYFGHVVAGSGMNRTRANKNKLRVGLDWALIKVNQNRIHRQMQGDLVVGSKAFHYDTRSFISGFSYDGEIGERLFKPGMELSKSGRSTKFTTAVYNGLRSAEITRLASKRGTGSMVEICWSTKVAPKNKEFAERGDSGSWIFDPDQGSVLGMLTGGNVGQDTTYVCLTEDIFDDIKDITGAIDVRIAPSP